jgi:UDP-N-acetylglucosamine 2-epimerase
MKKIIFVTGSRAEFDLVVNTLKILDKSNDFNLYVVLTGLSFISRLWKLI